MTQEFSSIAVSLIRQHHFCPRIPFFMFVIQLNPPRREWVEAGITLHQRIENLLKRRNLLPLTENEPYKLQTEVKLFDGRLGLHGVCDAVLQTNSGNIIPLEIKSKYSPPKIGEKLQLCAYAQLLEAMHNVSIRQGYILFEEKTRYKEIHFDEALRLKLATTIQEMHNNFSSGLLPRSNATDAQCSQCEFLNFCADRL